MDFLELPQLSQPEAIRNVRKGIYVQVYVFIFYKVFMGVEGEVVIEKKTNPN